MCYSLEISKGQKDWSLSLCNFIISNNSLKGLGHDLSSNFQISFFLLSMYTMVNVGIVNASSKFKSQIWGYKQDTESAMLCFVNKACLIFFLHMCCIGISFNNLFFLLLMMLFMNTLNNFFVTGHFVIEMVIS